MKGKDERKEVESKVNKSRREEEGRRRRNKRDESSERGVR